MCIVSFFISFTFTPFLAGNLLVCRLRHLSLLAIVFFVSVSLLRCIWVLLPHHTDPEAKFSNQGETIDDHLLNLLLTVFFCFHVVLCVRVCGEMGVVLYEVR